jgi:hypothetical protein
MMILMTGDMPSLQSLTGPGSSPKQLYVFFLLRLCSNYFETMRMSSGDMGNVDAATAALIAFCPDKGIREAIWNSYVNQKKKDDGNTMTASVNAVGDLITYLSESLEFVETATAGFL